MDSCQPTETVVEEEEEEEEERSKEEEEEEEMFLHVYCIYKLWLSRSSMTL